MELSPNHTGQDPAEKEIDHETESTAVPTTGAAGTGSALTVKIDMKIIIVREAGNVIDIETETVTEKEIGTGNIGTAKRRIFTFVQILEQEKNLKKNQEDILKRVKKGAEFLGEVCA